MYFCILTQYYPPETGAPQARLSELANYLIKRDHVVTVLTAMPNYPTGKIFLRYGGFYKQEVIDGVKVIRSYIYPSNSVKLIPRLLNYFSFVLSSFLVGIFTLPKCDILLTESPPLFLGISGFLISKVKKANWIFNVSDLWPETAVNLGIIGNGIPLTMSKKLEAFSYRKAWLVSGQSLEIVKNINERFPHIKTYRFSNGVDVEKFHPKNRTDILEKWSHGEKFTAVYAGLHGIAQGLNQLLKAASVLKKSLPDLKIILIGDGPEKNKLSKQAKKLQLTNLTFVESQNRALMPSIWASADIALIILKQYITGAVPSKLYEAMASGVPIVMVGTGEPAKIVNNAECGLVVQPDDIDGIASAIETLINNSDFRMDMGKNGRATAEEYYNRKNILNDFSKFLMTQGNIQMSDTNSHVYD